MKTKFFLITLMLLMFCSCSLEDDTPEFYQDIIPIASVDVPESFVYGQTHEIFVTYTRPSNCHIFNRFLWDVDGNERTISVLNTVYENQACIDANDDITVSFEIEINDVDTYIFKFYQGQNTDIASEPFDQYLIVEVPVEN